MGYLLHQLVSLPDFWTTDRTKLVSSKVWQLPDGAAVSVLFASLLEAGGI